MKKPVGIVLSLTLVFSAMAFPYTAVAADTVTGATTKPTTTPTTTTTTPAPTKTTTTPSKSTANGVIDTTNLPAGSVYSVVSGDCFSVIAKRYNMTTAELAKLNPQVKNISRIFVGDKLIVKAAEAATVAATKLYHGFGEEANYRLGHTSLNITSASVVFDEAGKIVNLKWDVQEISPELFPGWADEKTLSAADQAAFKAKIDDQWKTKWEEEDEYAMAKSAISGKEWYEQMDFYEKFFKGKTVADVKAWVAKYCDPKTNRPWKLAYLNSDKLKDADKEAIKAATANFTAEEKAMLVDVTTSATMSLQDDHSHFITALEEAFDAKTELK